MRRNETSKQIYALVYKMAAISGHGLVNCLFVFVLPRLRITV